MSCAIIAEDSSVGGKRSARPESTTAYNEDKESLLLDICNGPGEQVRGLSATLWTAQAKMVELTWQYYGALSSVNTLTVERHRPIVGRVWQ